MPTYNDENYDVSKRLADRAKPHEREGIVIAVGLTDIQVQPLGSTRPILCEMDPRAQVGDRCTVLWVPGRKKYILSSVFRPPKTIYPPKFNQILEQDRGTTQSIELTQIIQTIVDAADIALDDLTDVQIITPADGDVLTWVTASSMWKNLPITIPTQTEPVCFDGEILFWNGDVLMLGV